MTKELEIYIKDLAIDKLLQSEWGEKLQLAMKTFEKLQNHFYALSEKKGGEKSSLVKAITVMTFLVLKKVKSGKRIIAFDLEDWKEIAKTSAEFSIEMEEEKYVIYVFWMYEQYIRESASNIQAFATESTVNSIIDLANEIHYTTELFVKGEIGEVKYIESCLWLSSEAMLKLIASLTSIVMPEEFSDLAEALAMYAFEYGRFMLYSKEAAIVSAYIEEQYKLSEELENKYDLFLVELEQEANKFLVLIENAFVPDFRDRFLSSIKLAEAVGVDEKELLTSLDDIDLFFIE